MENQATQVSKSNLPAIGWILFIIGIVLMFNSLAYFFIYGPIFFACFIISIILMSNKNVGHGVSLLLINIILVPILWFGNLAYGVSETIKEHKEESVKLAAEKRDNISFEKIKIYSDNGFMYCEGKIRNNGSDSYDFVKVKVEWLDKTEKILDTDFTYAVSGESLNPGEAKSFRIMTAEDNSMKSARYYIMED